MKYQIIISFDADVLRAIELGRGVQKRFPEMSLMVRVVPALSKR